MKTVLISPAHYLLDHNSRSEFYFAGKLIHDLAQQTPHVKYFVICGTCNNEMPPNVILKEVFKGKKSLELNMFLRILFYLKVFLYSFQVSLFNKIDVVWHLFPNGRFSYNPFIFFQFDKLLNSRIKRVIGRLQYAKHDIASELSGFYLESTRMNTIEVGKLTRILQKKLFHVLGKFSNYYFNLFDRLIFNNQTAVDHYFRYCIKELAAPVIKIPVAVDTDRFTFTTKKLDNKIELLYSGILDANKRVGEVLKIAKELNSLGVNFHLSIVGDGEKRALLESQAKESLPTESYTFYGNIPKKDIHSFYEKAHFLFSLSSSESFGQVFAESWASGTLFIGSTIPVYKEVIEHKKNGLLVDVEQGDYTSLADTIASMSEAEFTSIVTEACRQVSFYAWPSVIDQYEREIIQNT